MPTITFDQLNGKGILNPVTFNANKTYNITMGAPTCTGSAYFTMEATRDADGSFDGFSPQPAKANFKNFVNISQDTLIKSKSPGAFESHVWSIVIPPGGGTFDYFPLTTTFNDTVFLRGTGGITFTYTLSIFVFTSKVQLQDAVNLWISDNALAISTYGQINTWDVSAITDMSNLFQDKTTFNSDISNWNVSNVTNMTNMFQLATAFNSPINNWDVRKVTNISRMFNYASSFQQPLNLWDLNALVTADLFMGRTGVAGAITYTLLDTLYNGWVVDFAALQPNVTIDFGDSTFTSAGLAAKNILVSNKGWTIFDGGQV
tara:strand:- start:158 stop:1108 length:951 start_codon:yes stop_codon:yes gene_type:complete